MGENKLRRRGRESEKHKGAKMQTQKKEEGMRRETVLKMGDGLYRKTPEAKKT